MKNFKKYPVEKFWSQFTQAERIILYELLSDFDYFQSCILNYDFSYVTEFEMEPFEICLQTQITGAKESKSIRQVILKVLNKVDRFKAIKSFIALMKALKLHFFSNNPTNFKNQIKSHRAEPLRDVDNYFNRLYNFGPDRYDNMLNKNINNITSSVVKEEVDLREKYEEYLKILTLELLYTECPLALTDDNDTQFRKDFIDFLNAGYDFNSISKNILHGYYEGIVYDVAGEIIPDHNLWDMDNKPYWAFKESDEKIKKYDQFFKSYVIQGMPLNYVL